MSESKKRIFVVIRNDDFSALSDLKWERYILEGFKDGLVPQTFGVVPFMAEDPHNPKNSKTYPLAENLAAVEFLRQSIGSRLIEVAMHGYTHRTNLFYPSAERPSQKGPWYPGPGEMVWSPFRPAKRAWYSEWRQIPFAEQIGLLKKGKEYLEATLNVKIVSFIPPWNSFDDRTFMALKEIGFQIISAKFSVHNYPYFILREDGPLFVECTTYLPGVLEAIKKARTFVASGGRFALIVLLYHSWSLKYRSDLEELLKSFLQEIKGAPDLEILPLMALPEVLRKGFREIAYLRALSRCHQFQADYFRKIFHLSCQNPTFEGLYVEDRQYYSSQIRKNRRLKLAFYILEALFFFLLGLLLSRLW